MTNDSTTIEPANSSSSSSSSNTTSRNKRDGLRHDDPGLAHITRPYALSRQQEQELLEDARRRRTVLLQNDCQDEDWYSRVTLKGVAVASKKQPDGPFCITKGTCEAPDALTLEDMAHQFDNDFKDNDSILRTYARIDPMNLHMTCVTDVQHKELLEADANEKLRILWGSFYVAPLISDRDFCLVMHTSFSKCPVTGDKVFCSNIFSIELPDAVPDLSERTGRVRAAVQMTGYIFRPHPSTTINTTATSPADDSRLQMAFVGRCDPKGMLPATIVNFASVSQALNVGRVRDSYQHFCQVVADFKLPHYVPLDCCSLPRLGGSVTLRIPLVHNKSETAAKTSWHVRLLVHCDHSITVQPTSTTSNTDTDGTSTLQRSVEVDTDDKEGFVEGKTMTFGGKADPVLDMIVQVTLPTVNANNNNINEKEYLELTFTNHGWRKATLCLPITMELSATPTSLQAAAALEATEQ